MAEKNQIKNSKKKVFIVKDKQPEQKYFDALKKIDVDFEWGIIPQNIDDFDGLLIPGGVDVNPKLYGQENTASVNMNDYLDEITINAIKLFYENDKAILGICRGLQILNVYFGGTLKQDIPNHKNKDHKIYIKNGNIIFDFYGNEMVVNSIHHQCIDILGKNLIVLANSEDGVIEAIMHENQKIIGTQFHPEKMDNGENIFKLFYSLL